MISLPDELIHEVTGYLTYEEGVSLAASDKDLFRKLYTNTYDIALMQAKKGFIYCISSNWVDAVKIILKREDRILKKSFTNPLKIMSYFKAVQKVIERCCFETADLFKLLAKKGFILRLEFRGPTFIKAVMLNRIDIVEVFLKDPSFHPNYKTNYALRIASRNGYAEMVGLLLTHPGVDPSMREDKECTELNSLDEAANHGHVDVVRLLLADSRTNPSLSAFGYGDALCFAAKNDHLDVVEVLLEDPRVDPGKDASKAFRLACYLDCPRIVKRLLQDPHVDPSGFNNDAIKTAARNGNYEVVELLLADTRVDPCANNCIAITKAAQAGYNNIVDLFLADPYINGVYTSILYRKIKTD